MKRLLLLAGLLAVMCAAGFAQNAAQQAALPRLAVVEFAPNPGTEKVKTDAVTVRNLVESQMVRTGKYQIIAREEIDMLLKNQQIQVSSISSADNVKKLQLQNISYIVTGSVDAMGSDYAITVKVLDVGNGKFSHSDDNFMGGDSRELYNGINALMTKFVAGMSTDESGDIVQGANKGAGKTYKVGDVGPGGGIIFYDRGFVSDGWRYLEAAPAGTDFTAQWGAYEKDVSGTNTSVGSGKRNTKLIVDRLKQLGENEWAAQICTGMEIGGLNDWFLPSKDELDLMYKNLKQKGLGGFSSRWYWSSSQFVNSYAWNQYFSDGSQGKFYKNYTLSVRAVRAF